MGDANAAMLAYIARRLCVGAVISSALLCNSAQAVLIRSGNGNTTAPVDDPGFANVGKSSTGNASVTYLGNRWVITANHVTIGNNLVDDSIDSNPQDGWITFGGTRYQIDQSTITQIGNADLKVFRLVNDPGLPSLNIASSGPNVGDPLVLVGNGLDRGNQHFWNVTGPPGNPTWTEVSPPGNRSGYDAVNGHTIRWGENAPNLIHIDDDGPTIYYKTKFDDLTYTGTASFTHEAQATNGDSGGGVFQKIGGQWFLSGIIFAEEIPLVNQPAGTAVFLDNSIIAELASYRSQILAVVPEPSTISLALFGAAGLLWTAYRRRTAA
jgi:Trypsin-like peptidase domain/PEP-CTERM motif